MSSGGEGGLRGTGGGGTISQEGPVTLGKVASEAGRNATVMGPPAQGNTRSRT